MHINTLGYNSVDVENISGSCRKVHNEELHNVCSAPNKGRWDGWDM
jgi:hypothetical protein